MCTDTLSRALSKLYWKRVYTKRIIGLHWTDEKVLDILVSTFLYFYSCHLKSIYTTPKHHPLHPAFNFRNFILWNIRAFCRGVNTLIRIRRRWLQYRLPCNKPGPIYISIMSTWYNLTITKFLTKCKSHQCLHCSNFLIPDHLIIRTE